MSLRKESTPEEANENMNPALIDIIGSNDSLKLIHGDFGVICKKHIPDNSIDLIFTDPPYDTRRLSLYGDLGTEAFRMLKECGSLLTYAPQNVLPEIFDRIGNSGLSYWWMITVVRNGGATRMHKQKLWVGWEPIIWFVKGNMPNGVNDILDTVRSQSIDKVLNIWEQSSVVSDYFIQNLTVKNETVLDPMMGSCITGISALRLGRKFIGINIDEKNFLTSQNRLQRITPYKYHQYSGMTEAFLVDRLKHNLAAITRCIKVSDTEKKKNRSHKETHYCD